MTDEERRLAALNAAVQYAQSHIHSAPSLHVVLRTAKAFEAYLKDGES